MTFSVKPISITRVYERRRDSDSESIYMECEAISIPTSGAFHIGPNYVFCDKFYYETFHKSEKKLAAFQLSLKKSSQRVQRDIDLSEQLYMGEVTFSGEQHYEDRSFPGSLYVRLSLDNGLFRQIESAIQRKVEIDHIDITCGIPEQNESMSKLESVGLSDTCWTWNYKAEVNPRLSVFSFSFIYKDMQKADATVVKMSGSRFNELVISHLRSLKIIVGFLCSLFALFVLGLIF